MKPIKESKKNCIKSQVLSGKVQDKNKSLEPSTRNNQLVSEYLVASSYMSVEEFKNA